MILRNSISLLYTVQNNTTDQIKTEKLGLCQLVINSENYQHMEIHYNAKLTLNYQQF